MPEFAFVSIRCDDLARKARVVRMEPNCHTTSEPISKYVLEGSCSPLLRARCGADQLNAKYCRLSSELTLGSLSLYHTRMAEVSSSIDKQPALVDNGYSFRMNWIQDWYGGQDSIYMQCIQGILLVW